MKFLDRSKDGEKEENPQDVLEEMLGEEPMKEQCEEDCIEEGEAITLDAYFRASYPLLWIRTEEDQRAIELIQTNLKKLTRTSVKIIWGEFKHTTGLLVNEKPGELTLGANPKKVVGAPVQALQYISQEVTSPDDNPIVLVMHNMNPAMKIVRKKSARL